MNQIGTGLEPDWNWIVGHYKNRNRTGTGIFQTGPDRNRNTCTPGTRNQTAVPVYPEPENRTGTDAALCYRLVKSGVSFLVGDEAAACVLIKVLL